MNTASFCAGIAAGFLICDILEPKYTAFGTFVDVLLFVFFMGLAIKQKVNDER